MGRRRGVVGRGRGMGRGGVVGIYTIIENLKLKILKYNIEQ